MTNITIALTSCWRYKLLKKTVESLSLSCNLQTYDKILTEDSRDKKHIEKIKTANLHWFLKWWQIIFTWWVGELNQEKHYNALKILYSKINTKYVFHCEDDWCFKKVNYDFIKVSKDILDKNNTIGIIQLEDTFKSWSLNSIEYTKEERWKQLYSDKEFIHDNIEFKIFNYEWTNIDWHYGFSLRPGLRRTSEMKKIMFWYEGYVDEAKMAERFRKENLIWLCFADWIWIHLWTPIKSTKFAFKNLWKIWNWFYEYRIKTILIKRIIIPFLWKLYIFCDKIYPIRYLMDILSWIYRHKTVQPISESLLINKEWVTEYNIPISWFTEKKPLWISWVARIKNGDDFLEKVIESHIDFLDEIILVDNMSTDNTKEICMKLEKKYPEKIKFYSYEYKVNWPWSKLWKEWNSIHSFAYYSNWCQSKAKYKYIMKIDDDNLFNHNKWIEIRNYIIRNNPNKYMVYWGYNLIKTVNWIIWISKDNTYIWRYWDHWIYPVSKYNYYIVNKCYGWYNEFFINNLFFKRFGFSFYHLKYLKKNNWMINLKNKSAIRHIQNILHKSHIINKKVPNNIINNILWK